MGHKHNHLRLRIKRLSAFAAEAPTNSFSSIFQAWLSRVIWTYRYTQPPFRTSRIWMIHKPPPTPWLRPRKNGVFDLIHFIKEELLRHEEMNVLHGVFCGPICYFGCSGKRESLTGREASTATSPFHPTNQRCWFHASHQSAHAAGKGFRLSTYEAL